MNKLDFAFMNRPNQNFKTIQKSDAQFNAAKFRIKRVLLYAPLNSINYRHFALNVV